MKSIILGAFIIGLFFAVAQSISVGQKHYKYSGKNTGIQAPAISADTAGAYATMQLVKARGLRPTAILSQAK